MKKEYKVGDIVWVIDPETDNGNLVRHSIYQSEVVRVKHYSSKDSAYVIKASTGWFDKECLHDTEVDAKRASIIYRLTNY